MSMCGSLRKVSTLSSSHLGGVEGEGVPVEHVWQGEEGFHSLKLTLVELKGKESLGEHVWQVEESVNSLQHSPWWS